MEGYRRIRPALTAQDPLETPEPVQRTCDWA